MKKLSNGWIWVIFMILMVLPFLLAYLNQGNLYVFGGFLLNPKDGNTYLAKMYEGWEGSWKFTLAYTAEKGEGAYLFLFYLALGHLARWTGLPLILVFHLARLGCAAILFLAMRDFAGWVFLQQPREARSAWLIGSVGSGLGWLAVAFGWVTSDLWVAEAYPFLSGFTNPHFSLGISLLLCIFIDLTGSPTWARLLRLSVYGILLSLVMPFGLVVAGVVGAAWLAWEWRLTQRLSWKTFAAALHAGGLYLAYQFYVMQTDPLFSRWNAQNLTPSPTPADLAVSLLPAGVAAVWGIRERLRKRELNPQVRLLIAWLVTGLVVIYFPFNLQRRFMFAYFIPVAFLAVAGLGELHAFRPKIRRLVTTLFILFSVLTNLVVLTLALFGIASHSPNYYLSRDEASAFEFIRANTNRDSVILSSPEIGIYIPGWTGHRVVYGHEFETVDAVEKLNLVRQFFSPDLAMDQSNRLFDQNKVKYIFWGPRERALGMPAFLTSLTPVYQNGTVEIFSR